MTEVCAAAGAATSRQVMSQMVAAPWTQRIQLGWRPDLNFYDNRTGVLRGFEDQGVLRAFGLTETGVAAQLFDSRDRLSVQQDGLTLDLDRPDADVGRAWKAVEQAFVAVGPRHPRTVQAGFRHVSPIGLPFADAIKRGYGTVLGNLSVPAVNFGDWAILADLSLASDPLATGQIEFGVVTRQEAVLRLSGQIPGRALAEMHPGIPTDPNEFPEVGLFSYMWVSKTMSDQGPFLVQARRFWEEARQEVDKLVDSLQAMFLGAEYEEKNTG